MPSIRKTKTGVVIRKSSDKTLIVEVTRLTKDSLFNKYVRKRKKFYVHDEGNKAKVGDKVTIIESRPISKLKRWRLASVIGKN